MAGVAAVEHRMAAAGVEHRMAAAAVERRMAAGVAVAAKGITSAILA
jgi:hypothetical protein